MMASATGNARGYLPTFVAGDRCAAVVRRRDSVPDNWTIGSSFHNLSARAQRIRRRVRDRPRNTDVTVCATRTSRRRHRLPRRDADELFEIARLVVAAEIAKIHTTDGHRAAVRRTAAPCVECDQASIATTSSPPSTASSSATGTTMARRPIQRPPPSWSRRRHPTLGGDCRPSSQSITSTAGQSLRLAVQFSGGVRHRLPAARAGADLIDYANGTAIRTRSRAGLPS